MDTNIALADLASRMAVRIGAEYRCGVHDAPPGYAWTHCHEKYVWTPVCFTTSPHHGLVRSYPQGAPRPMKIEFTRQPRRRPGRRHAQHDMTVLAPGGPFWNHDV